MMLVGTFERVLTKNFSILSATTHYAQIVTYFSDMLIIYKMV